MRLFVCVSLIINFQLSTFNLVQAQERDRLAELPVECLNPAVTYTSVAPDGSLWMVTHCDEIFRADDIHSPWKILQEGELGGRSWNGEDYENIIAFDRNTAVIVGHMWGEYFKRTTTKGVLWDSVKYVSNKQGPEWFHPVWRGEGGLLWAGSQDGFLTFSADSGRTFTTLRDSAFDHKTGIDNIYMLTADSGWIVCHDGSLYSTSDNWHTYHRWPTPNDKGVDAVRPWKNYLVATQGSKSYYTILGDTLQWKRTPLTIWYLEIDTATGMMWAEDDKKQVVLMEDIDRWKPMGVKALSFIGIHDGRLYCRVDGGVIRVGADGVVDNCPFLTDERPLEQPEHTFAHGNLLWGHDGKSVYIQDAEGWYRVARPFDIEGMTPDPNRDDRVIVMTEISEWLGSESGKTFSVDTAGHIEPYIHRQPLAAFVKPGLQNLEILTYETFGWNVHKEIITFERKDNWLKETSRRVVNESYDPHFGDGIRKKLLPMECGDDTTKRQLPLATVEQGLLALGERYNLYPTPQDFGLTDTTLDMHKVYYHRNTTSSNVYGYLITIVNQAGDSLTAEGYSSAGLDLGSSTHFPWMLPMTVRWRGAEFFTYQPALWQALREAMPDSMMHKNYLDNSALHVKDTLKSGDLVFLSNDWSDIWKATIASTGRYSHVAIVERDSAGVWVIEATPKEGVRKQSYGELGNRYSWPRMGFHVYRPTIPFDTSAVITRAKSLIGKPFDNAFQPDNDAYYGSELIQAAFGDLVESEPMNWRDKDGKLVPYWEKHFKELGIPVPEGIPGTSPTGISRSKWLRKL